MPQPVAASVSACFTATLGHAGPECQTCSRVVSSPHPRLAIYYYTLLWLQPLWLWHCQSTTSIFGPLALARSRCAATSELIFHYEFMIGSGNAVMCSLATLAGSFLECLLALMAETSCE